MIKRNLRPKNIKKLDFKIFHESSKEKGKKNSEKQPCFGN